MTVFTWPVRVYYEDTDAGGIVFYANYLKFFERARTEWLRAAGIGQQQLRDVAGLIFVVTETRVRYLMPARLDDTLHITLQTQAIGRASLQLAQQAWLEDRLLAEAEVRIGCVSAATLKPVRIPDALLSAIQTP